MAQISRCSPGEISSLKVSNESPIYATRDTKGDYSHLSQVDHPFCFQSTDLYGHSFVTDSIRDFSSLCSSSPSTITLQSLTNHSTATRHVSNRKMSDKNGSHTQVHVQTPENAFTNYLESPDTPKIIPNLPLISLTNVSPELQSKRLNRTRSLPNLYECSAQTDTPSLQRKGDSWRTPSQNNNLGGNQILSWNSGGSSLSQTGSGRRSPMANGLREGVIDLTQADPDGSSGHKRRVLVRPLPALQTSRTPGQDVVDARGFAQPSDGQESDRNSPIFGWRRPRAFSCDVTLEVDVGRDLRKVANEFNKTATSSTFRARGVIAGLLRSWTSQRVPTAIHEISPNIDGANPAPP